MATSALDELRARLTVPRTRVNDRPWVALSMVAALDGATAVAGTSGSLGNDTDRAVLVTMREVADAVLVGASTVRAEGYRPPKRSDLDLIVVSRSLALDWDTPLWGAPNVIVATTVDAPPTPHGVRSVRVGRGDVDLARMLQEMECTTVVAEGGPTLNGQLLREDVVDELVLTIAPFMVAGRSARVSADDEEHPRRFTLSYAVPDGDWLFVRHLRSR